MATMPLSIERSPSGITAEFDGGPDERGGEPLRLVMNDVSVICRLHRAATNRRQAILWMTETGGTPGGPAGGLYERMAARLAGQDVTSLQVRYSHPAHFAFSVRDVLAGIAFLEEQGWTAPGKTVLVGHCFGGAVAIAAGARHPGVAGVAALCSQTSGTEEVARIAPRHILLIHGETDEVLPDDCSRDIFRRASEPKTLIVYPDCRHSLHQRREDVERDLTVWLDRVLLSCDQPRLFASRSARNRESPTPGSSSSDTIA